MILNLMFILFLHIIYLIVLTFIVPIFLYIIWSFFDPSFSDYSISNQTISEALFVCSILLYPVSFVISIVKIAKNKRIQVYTFLPLFIAILMVFFMVISMGHPPHTYA